MVDLAGIWESLNDKCWPLLDALHIGDFFDDNNLPPILFPLAVIAVVILLLLLLSGGGGPVAKCGDGMCTPPENATTCPDDCNVGVRPGIAGKKVIVRFTEVPSCTISVSIYDASGALQGGQQEGSATAFTFNGIESDSIYVFIEDSNQQSQRTPTQSIPDSENIIQVTLSSNLCKPEGVSGPNGVLRLSIKDAVTNAPLNGVIVTIVDTVFRNRLINGGQDFTLPALRAYTIYAEKEGYQAAEEFTPSIDPNVPTPKVISMTPLPGGSGQTGELEVCVSNGTAPITSGLIRVQGEADDYLLIGDLSQVNSTAEPSGPGCYVFQSIPAGKIVSVSASQLPMGCIPAATQPVTIAPMQRQRVNLQLDCTASGGVGYLKARIMSKEGEILTQNATITLWLGDGTLIPGTAIANSLAYGSSGYTEELTVPSNKSLYVWVRNLPSGYLDFKSGMITVAPGQHKAASITLNYSQGGASSNFTFSGVASPNVLSRGENFEVTVNDILFGQTKLSGDAASVDVSINNQSCTVFYDTIWHADCTAPSDTGEYKLAIKATYEQRFAIYSIDVEVRERAPGASLMAVTPAFATRAAPPLELFYEVKFNGTPISDIADQRMELTYLDSPSAYSGTVSNLTQSDDGYWMLTADVPYKGDYQLNMYIEVLEGGVYYSASYTFGFTATEHSPNLKAEVSMLSTILNVGETFQMDIVLTHNRKIASRLDILKLLSGNIAYTIPWDQGSQQYSLPISAPVDETCTLQMRLVINGAEVPMIVLNGEESYTGIKAHVIDLGATKAAICPLDRQASCKSKEEVRVCVENYKSQSAPYQEQQVVGCILSGCGDITPVQCPNSNKGDLVPDCQLDAADVSTAEQFISTTTSAEGRNQFVACMDMDNNDVVDTNDFTCLKNLVAKKWYGDVGDGSCSEPMNGGFCFQIDTDSPIPGDLRNDGRIDATDEQVMQKIIAVASAGVVVKQEISKVADFNKDSKIDNTDLTCLRAFKTVDFTTGSVIPTQSRIPQECVSIFNLQCRGSRGDLNGDGKVDEMDYIILNMMANDMIDVTSGMLVCADINEDGAVTKDDLQCVGALLQGNQQDWLICLGCEENMPPAAYVAMEICNDGFDNNCDKKKDLGDSLCRCNEQTPCDMKYDMDGGSNPGVDDGNYKICRNVDWDQSGYQWFTEDELKCVKDKQCQGQTCNGQTWICSSATGSSGRWYAKPSQAYASCVNTINCCKESDSGYGSYCEEYYYTCAIGGKVCGNKEGQVPNYLPGESEAQCEDGWDNDCIGGDMKCPSDDGGECLYVYSISDGKRYLDHIAYPLSILPTMETYTYGTMTHLKPENGLLMIEISEELPEITNINSVALFAVDHPAGTAVIPDQNGGIRTVASLIKPLSCVSKGGADCYAELSTRDKRAYRFDLQSFEGKSVEDIQDSLVMEFPKPAGVRKAKIVLKGVESGAITFVWWKILERMGNENIVGLLAGSDPSASEVFDSFVERNAKVSVHVWDGKRWVLAGSRYLPFSLNLEGGEEIFLSDVPAGQEILKVKLTFPYGAFIIDSLAVDYSNDMPVRTTKLPMLFVRSPTGADAIDSVLNDDDKYLTLTIGDRVNIAFLDAPALAGTSRSYMISDKGYYTFDVPKGGEASEENLQWLMGLLTDDRFLLQYALDTYLTERPEFLKVFHSFLDT